MKVEIKLEPGLTEPYAQIHTAEITEQIQETLKVLGSGQNKVLTGYKDKKIYVLNPQDIICFFCEGQNVFARTSTDKFTVKIRLYELEEQLTGTPFVRISSSAIANADCIDCLEMNFNGTMRVQFKDGSFEYASRRYVIKIKKYLGL
jgi:DNA-binding LytR/AlgR family response regulator